MQSRVVIEVNEDPPSFNEEEWIGMKAPAGKEKMPEDNDEE